MNMKNLIIITAVFVFFIPKMYAQSPVKSAADLAWEALNGRRTTSYDTAKEKFTLYKEQEVRNRKYLEEGYKFCNQYPNDIRTWKWFIAIRGYRAPEFWKDIDEGAKLKTEQSYNVPIDWKLYDYWEQRLLVIRNSYMNHKDVSEIDKSNLAVTEMETEFWRSKNSRYIGNKKRFIEKTKNLIINAFTGYRNGDDNSYASRTAEIPFLYSSDYGLNQKDLLDIVTYLAISDNQELVAWASKKISLYKLLKEPFELKGQAIDGNEIDLSKLRGKVVLVDFWSTSCSTCISRMPVIKTVYDQYKQDGFLVLSAAYNSNIDKESVLAIHHKVGAEWPVMLIGGDAKSGYVASNSIGDKIWKKYGFSYVPQMLLLDKQGKLVLYNGVLINGDFEPLVRNLLKQ